MSDVSMIGLGAMGSALAGALLKNGLRVTVWNRSPAKAAPLVDKGAVAAPSIRDAVEASKLIVTCLLVYDTVYEAFGPAEDVLTGRSLVNLTNGTPAQAREMARWAGAKGAGYLDGGIMATPPMIGGEHALILYSGSKTAFDPHRSTLEAMGAANWLGEDAGLASLHDLALLSGMYGLFAGFFHATALVDSEGVGAASFLKLLRPWLTAMMDEFPGYAAKIDSGMHGTNVVSNLGMQTASLGNILTASRQQGVAPDLLDPMLDLFRRRSDAGFGDEDISGVFELIRHKNRGAI